MLRMSNALNRPAICLLQGRGVDAGSPGQGRGASAGGAAGVRPLTFLIAVRRSQRFILYLKFPQ
jgi:hypothetical protein